MQRLEMLFPPELRDEAIHLLENQCGYQKYDKRLYPTVDANSYDRVRFAALKISGGTIEGLQQAVDLYNEDYRDLLMSADFGYDIHVHLDWMPESACPTDSSEPPARRWWEFWKPPPA